MAQERIQIWIKNKEAMALLTCELLTAQNEMSEWDDFVSRSPQGTLFCRQWWLDAAMPNSFEILVARKDGAIVAGMLLPYIGTGKKRQIIRPPMSATMGILLSESGSHSSYEKQLSDEINVMGAIVEALPPYIGFSASCHPTISNWLPFYWRGYQQTTHYTYVLENIGDSATILSGMDHSKRKNLKRSQMLITIDRDITAEEFYLHHKLTLAKEGKVISYRMDYLSRIVQAAQRHAHLEILAARDGSGALHSMIVVLFDKVSAYYIASSIDPEHRNSGSATLLLVEAMRLASTTTGRFDFEGSMIPGVERSFRKFGARQVPYFHIFKEGGLRPKLHKAIERVARKFGIKE